MLEPEIVGLDVRPSGEIWAAAPSTAKSTPAEKMMPKNLPTIN